MFRDILQFAPWLAHFYLIGDGKRNNKLLQFDCKESRNKDSKLFLIATGGDEVPSTDTTFLLSFLNVLKRIANSSENYVLFGSNAKENGLLFNRYVQKLISDIKILEKKKNVL